MPQKRGLAGSIALMSHVIKMIIVGIMPAITAFIESHSASAVFRTASRYETPIICFMNSA